MDKSILKTVVFVGYSGSAAVSIRGGTENKIEARLREAKKQIFLNVSQHLRP